MNPVFPFKNISALKSALIKSESVFRKGERLVENDMCLQTAQDGRHYKFIVEDRFDDFKVQAEIKPDTVHTNCECGSVLDCCSHAAAALIALYHKLDEPEDEPSSEGQAYTRKEMIKRVLRERREKSEKEEYSIEYSDTLYGFHKIKTTTGKIYEITIRDFETDDGYCSCPDFKTNKLGTCKHLIFAVDEFKSRYSVEKLIQKQRYPFVEIYCDPHNDYNITYFYQTEPQSEIKQLIEKYFSERYIMPDQYSGFLKFFNEALNFKSILIRPEVRVKIEKYFEEQFIHNLSLDTAPDFSKIRADLFDYQKEGVFFSLFKYSNIIADEMGLGKTLQAISTAVLKKDIFDLKRTLVICPASLKYQWKKEIERFCDEKAMIVEGPREVRHSIYRKSTDFFIITNYEAVLRDVTVLRKYPPDMIILDEAQRIKNYDTKTSHAVKSIPKKHALVITGTPLENRLLDLYSIMNFIDPEILAPQWEFSMNHCYFDKSVKNKITGYFNLQQLKERLSDVIIRREKSDVFNQLPSVQEVIVPVEMHPDQQSIHAGLAQTLAPILAKKHKTIYDMQRIQQILMTMRMVCDSTYLYDKETNISPKLDELQEILFEKLDIKNKGKKVIIFSEWKTMLRIISKMLNNKDVTHVMLSGEVAVNKRGRLIDEFASNPDCLVFLSTEAGGTGLNLQFADTVINFDLPWNPAKKNQRIGRINRIGQESTSITAINLVSLNSIESKIADGIVLKQSLFDAVLNEGDMTDEVDFSAKGRSTFIDQVQKLLQPSESPVEMEDEPLEWDAAEMADSEEAIDAVTTETEAESTSDSLPATEKIDRKSEPPKPDEIETTLNQGMQFLNGIFKMATGKELISKDQGISVNHDTGEVVMKFKLPGF